MKRNRDLPRFTLQNLFGGTLVIAVILAFLAHEPIIVAFAALFCFLSCTVISVLILLTGRNLAETVTDAYQQKKLSILSRRIRWLYVDGLILVWGLITISVTNFVQESSIANAKYFVLAGWVAGPAVAVAVFVWRRTDWKKSP